ncbi:MAG: peptidase dimerization domain-containing protein [Paracoccaceae bacterium]
MLPSQASAKLSFRLVGTQDPAAIRKSFRAYLEAKLPPGFSVEYRTEKGSPASQMSIEDPMFRKGPLRAFRRMARDGGLYRLRRPDPHRGLFQVDHRHGSGC